MLIRLLVEVDAFEAEVTDFPPTRATVARAIAQRIRNGITAEPASFTYATPDGDIVRAIAVIDGVTVED